MRYLLLISIFLLVSCTKKQKSYEITTVDIDSGDDNGLVIDKQINTDYGPSADIGSSSEHSSGVTKEPIIGLNYYSTLYNSLSVIDLIKNIESQNINISVMSANGLASLLVCLYAKEKSVSYLEWKLFELRKRLVKYSPFSNSWKKELKKFLNNEFKDLKLHQMKMLVLIPTIKDGEVTLQRSGNVAEKVYAAINIANKSNFIRKPKLLKGSLKEFSVDVSLDFFSLSIRPKLVKVDGLNWGIYTKYLGFLINNTNIIKNESTTELAIDDIQPLSDIQKSFQFANQEFSKKLIDRINQWKQENSASSN